jgi:hypothetical protein
MNVSPSIVRPATFDDERQIWVLLREMWDENGLFPLSEPKVQYYLDRVLHPETIPLGDTGPRGIIGVIGASSYLEGIIMLVLGQVWYSDTISLQDCVNFVRHECRQTSAHAKELIAYSKRMTDEIRKADPDFQMMVGVVSTKRTAAKVRLYRRQLAEVGAFFVYPTPAGYEPAEAAQR